MKKTSLPSYPQLLKKHIIKPYDKIVDTYTKHHFIEPIFAPILSQFVIQLPKAARVLDAGCGPGGETTILLKHDLRVVSIDVSSKMLTRAKKLVPSGNFLEMDLTRLEFPDNSFTGIWCARALIHIPTPMISDVLKGFWRILQSGGIACLTVLTGDIESIEPEYYDESHSTSTFFHHFQASELEAELKKVGFKVQHIEKTYLGEEREEHLSVFAKKRSIILKAN